MKTKILLYLLCINTMFMHILHPEEQPEEDTVIVCHEEKERFPLQNKFRRISQYLYKNLNFSPFFNIKKLLNPPKMRTELTTPFQGDGEHLTITSEEKETIHCTFFNRNSDTLLVIGTGFGNEREKVAPFVHMFSNYDIIIFDYRGHGYDQPPILDTSKWSIKPTYIIKKIIKTLTPFLDWSKIPHVDLSKTTMGEKEDEDLLAVINHCREQKEYTNIFGIGLCFSSHIFAKAAAKHKNLFKKLILDSSLYSIQDLIDRITESPQLILDPQRGEWPIATSKKSNYEKSFLQSICENSFTKAIRSFLKRTLNRMVSKIIVGTKKSNNKTTAEYLSQLPQNMPVLVCHGNNDVMTLYDKDFLKNLHESQLKNIIGISFKDSRHLLNHIKYKEEYACIGNLFFELPFTTFVECLKDPEKLINLKISEIQEQT